jgi:hypothetical protein
MFPENKIKCFPFDVSVFNKEQNGYVTKTIGIQKIWKEGDDTKSTTIYVLLNDIPKLMSLLNEIYKDELKFVKEKVECSEI